jgi:hypothetical protein
MWHDVDCDYAWQIDEPSYSAALLWMVAAAVAAGPRAKLDLMETMQLLFRCGRSLTDKHEYTVHSLTSCQPAKWSKLNARMVVKQLQLTGFTAACDLQIRPMGLHNAYMTAEPCKPHPPAGYGQFGHRVE